MKVKKLNITTFKRTFSLLSGNFRSKFIGTGIDFSDLRKYELGDDVKNIDWLNTAKHNKVFVKKYEEEKQIPALFVLNVGDSMKFSLGDRNKLHILKDIFLILSYTMISNGDPISYLTFGDEIIGYKPFKKGLFNLNSVINEIDLNMQKPNLGSVSGFYLAINSVYSKKPRNNMIIIITDDYEIKNEKIFKTLCKTNDLIYIHISDDIGLNKDLSGDFSFVYNKTSLSLDLSSSRLMKSYEDLKIETISNLKSKIHSLGGSFITFDKDTNIYKELLTFFKLRQKYN